MRTPTQLAMFGAGGFIGTSLAYRLDQSGRHACTLFDLADAKIKLRYGNAPYQFVRCDIGTDDDRIERAVAGSDAVVHLAALVHPRVFVRRPLDVVRTNFFDALKIVDACVRHRRRLIHFSTSEVYGKTGGSMDAFNEDRSDCILGPVGNHRWIYSNAKQLLDRIIHAHGLNRELDYTILRPFNFVGPLMDRLLPAVDGGEARVFAHFMSALLYRRPLLLVGGGTSRRCFTHIDDAVRAIELVLDNPEAMHNQIVNIGNPANETTIRDLALQMKAIFRREFDASCDAPIETVDAAEFYGPGYEDCDRRLPDIAKLAGLGWSPRIGLEETLASTMRYFVEHRTELETVL